MRYFYPFLGCAFLLFVWQAITFTEVFSPALLPGPGRVAGSLRRMAASGELLDCFLGTLYRWLFGFLLGVMVGIPLGLLMGHIEPVRRTLAIPIDAARSLPVIALMPLFLLFFGIGNSAKIAATAWAAALSVLLNTMYGSCRVKEQWLLTAKTIGATPADIFFKVVVPGSLPDIVVGLRIAISHALVIVIASEMILGGGADGLGRRLVDAAMLFRTADAYALLCVIGLLGYMANIGFVLFERWYFPWLGK